MVVSAGSRPIGLPSPSTVPQPAQVSIMNGLVDRQAGNARAASQRIMELSAEFLKLDTEHAYLKEEYSKLKESDRSSLPSPEGHAPLPESPPVPTSFPARSSTAETAAPLPDDVQLSTLTIELESAKNQLRSLEGYNQTLLEDMAILRQTHQAEIEQYRQLMLSRQHTGKPEDHRTLLNENCKMASELSAYRQQVSQLESQLVALKTESYNEMKALRQENSMLRDKVSELSVENEKIQELQMSCEEKDRLISTHLQDSLLVEELRKLVKERGESIAAYAQSAEVAEEKVRFTEGLLEKMKHTLLEEQGKTKPLQEKLKVLKNTYESDLLRWKKDSEALEKLKKDHFNITKELQKKINDLSGSAESKLKADMAAMLTMQSTAIEQDGLLVAAKAEINSLRSRYDAVSKEKDLLMSKLVEERSKPDLTLGLPQRSTSLLMRPRPTYAEAGQQTEERKPTPRGEPECSLMHRVDEEPETASIDELKARMEYHSDAVKDLQKKVALKGSLMSTMRECLQKKLREAMEKLDREKDVMSFISECSSPTGSWASSRVVSSASRSETPFIRGRLEMTADQIQKFNSQSAFRPHTPPSTTELQQKITELNNLQELLDAKGCGYSHAVVSPSRSSNRCPTISPADAAPFTARIGGGTLHLPGGNTL